MVTVADPPDPIVSRLSLFAPFEDGQRSRAEICELNTTEIVTLIRAAFDASGAKALSLDVFDTLLLRDNSSELRRFWEMANMTAEGAAASGIFSTTGQDVMFARIEATRLAYRSAEKSGAFGEGQINDIYTNMVARLGAPDELFPILRAVELRIEIAHLTANPVLVAIASDLAVIGVPTVLLSDMYLSGSMIEELVETICGTGSLFPIVQSSADLAHSKRSGTAFAFLAERLGFEPGDFFHIGDSVRSDVINAQNAGFIPLHFPILRHEREARNKDLQVTAQDLIDRQVALPGVVYG